MSCYLSVRPVPPIRPRTGVRSADGWVSDVRRFDAWSADAWSRRNDGRHAVEHGAVERVRPKMMTVTAIMAGLIPILWSQGTGADVMKRIAAPIVGGMISSTVLTLVVIPAIYSLWKEREVRRASVRGTRRRTAGFADASGAGRR